MSILDQVARSISRTPTFRPTTTQEYFALRLAARLGDTGAACHYADPADQYSRVQLLEAYSRAVKCHADNARRFHLELLKLNGNNGGSETRGRLAAIRIDRRAIAAAILNADHLHFTDARQLSSSPDKALEGTIRFVTRQIMDKFRFGSVVLEIIPNGHEKHRTLFQQAAIRALSSRTIGILEVSKTDLFSAFAYPPLRFRGDLQKVMSAIYPALDGEPGAPWIHDAAALGLYVQTERLFNKINQLSP